MLRRELLSLGLNIKINNDEMKGGVHFRLSSLDEILKCHLYLGTASHIFLRAGEPFRATGMEELVRKVAKMDFWKRYMSADINSAHSKAGASALTLPNFEVRVTAQKSRLYHTKGIAERVERGIANALGMDDATYLLVQQNRSTSTRHPEEDPILILVRVDQNEVEISVDTSSTPLHRRGYRLESGKAPMREDLAYAFLYSLGWNNINNKYGGLLDPMCGSGTILIEGASMLFGLPPGRLRPPPMKHSTLFHPRAWEELVSASSLAAAIRIDSSKKEHVIMGSDRDAGVIQSANENMKRAGVADLVQLHTCSISANPWFQDSSSFGISNMLVATNPPYGVRVSKNKPSGTGNFKLNPLLPLYQTLGHRVMNADEGAEFGIVAHDVQLARQTGVRLNALFTTRHGGLSVSALGTTGLLSAGRTKKKEESKSRSRSGN